MLETVREGPRLRASLRRAREAGIEVVMLPVGGSPLGAAMVAAHSGAIAGDDATWEALCEDTGSIRVGDLAELDRHPGAAVRAATVDPAHRVAASRPSTTPAPSAPAGRPRPRPRRAPRRASASATAARLAAELDEGLEPRNPLDVWGEGRDTRELFGACLTAMAADPAVGVTVLAVDLVEEYDGDTSYPDAVVDAAAATGGRSPC